MYLLSDNQVSAVTGGMAKSESGGSNTTMPTCPDGYYWVHETSQNSGGGGGGGSVSGQYGSIGGSASGGGGSNHQSFQSYKGCVPDGYGVTFDGPHGSPVLMPLQPATGSKKTKK